MDFYSFNFSMDFSFSFSLSFSLACSRSLSFVLVQTIWNFFCYCKIQRERESKPTNKQEKKYIHTYITTYYDKINDDYYAFLIISLFTYSLACLHACSLSLSLALAFIYSYFSFVMWFLLLYKERSFSLYSFKLDWKTKKKFAFERPSILMLIRISRQLHFIACDAWMNEIKQT